MRKLLKSSLAALAVGCGIAAAVHAEDIDIFIGASSGTSDYPNVLIVIDNSNNWQENSQNWPTDASAPAGCGNGCNSKQGYYELKALRTVLNALPTNALTGDVEVNLGLMMFNHTASDHNGGYVRSAIKKMSAANKAAFLATIDAIILNFGNEGAGASVSYGPLLWDAFKYFGGYTDIVHATKDQAPSATPSYDGAPIFGTTFAGANNQDTIDAAAYSGTSYLPPTQTSCGKNYIIFVGNGFPDADPSGNPDFRNLLKYLNDAASPAASVTELQMASYTCSAAAAWSNASGSSCGACTAPLSSASIQYRCDTSNCSGNNKRLQQCTSITTTYAAPAQSKSGRYADEFINFLFKTDVNSAAGQQNVVTYALDVFKDRPSTDQTALLRNMAKYGGGQYFTASDEDSIVAAFKQMFAEITSVNSTFASASLPVNATNRAQNENQVFIGMFRPDVDAKPRWFGNVKRYQIVMDGNDVTLGDKDGSAAVSSQTGFILDCATSYWTSDSGNYWSDYTVKPNPASRCTTSTNNENSDAPDGPRVEKGAVAEVIRKGNNPTATDGTPTWQVNRTIYATESTASTTLAALSGLSTLSSDGTNLKNWVLGYDVGSDSPAYGKENASGNKETRASIHGDVVHSRPLPVNYGSSIVVYYGANDGMLRAIDAATGKEKWAFLPYEFNSRLQRLQDNKPKVNYPGITDTPTPTAKDYFWDGSIGIVQNADSSQVWLYPTMRRGGRMIYALDVSNANSPSIKWKAGCPNLTDDTGCVAVSDIGQTWAMPNAAPVRTGESTSSLVVFMGGGYDACEDANTASPSCGSAKGRGVYVFDAASGEIVKQLSTTRSVPADIALADVDGNGYADYAYAADTGGNLYRISMVSRTVAVDGSVSYTPREPADWTITRIAYTTGTGGPGGARKFLFPPSLLPTSPAIGKVYLAIGSGDREHPLEAHYPYGGVRNRFYVFLDDLSSTASFNLDDTATMNNVTTDPGCDASKVLPTGSTKGWFMDLNQYGQGEQTVTSSVIVGGLIAFSTNRPIPVPAGTCSTALGEARGYWVNLLNGSGAIGVAGACGGSRSGAFVGGGLPPSPVVGTVPIDGQPTTVVIGAADKDGVSNKPLEPGKVKPTITAKRKRVYQYTTGDN